MAEAGAPQGRRRSNSPQGVLLASALETRPPASQGASLGSWAEAKGAVSCAVAIAAKHAADDEHEHHLWEKVRDLMKQRRKQYAEGNGENSGPRAKASTAKQRALPSSPARTVLAEPSRPSTRSTPELTAPTLAIPFQLRPTGEPIQDPSSDGMVQTHMRDIKVLRETIEVMREERQAQDWQLLDALAKANSVTPSPLRSVPRAPYRLIRSHKHPVLGLTQCVSRDEEELKQAAGKSQDVIGQCCRTLQMLSASVLGLLQERDELKVRLQSLSRSQRYRLGPQCTADGVSCPLLIRCGENQEQHAGGRNGP